MRFCAVVFTTAIRLPRVAALLRAPPLLVPSAASFNFFLSTLCSSSLSFAGQSALRSLQTLHPLWQSESVHSTSLLSVFFFYFTDSCMIWGTRASPIHKTASLNKSFDNRRFIMRQLPVLQNSPQEILHAQQSLWHQLFTAVITVNTIVCELSYQQTLLNLLLELPQYPKTASNSVPLSFNATASSQACCHTLCSAAASATNKGQPQARQGHEKPSSISNDKQSSRFPLSPVIKVPSGEPDQECKRARPARCQRRPLHRRCNHALQPELENSRAPNFRPLASNDHMTFQSLRHLPCFTAVSTSNEAPHNHAFNNGHPQVQGHERSPLIPSPHNHAFNNGQSRVRQGQERSPSIPDNKLNPRSTSAAEVKMQSGKREDRAQPAHSFSVVQARHSRKPPLITKSFATANPFAALSLNKRDKVSKPLRSPHEENPMVSQQRRMTLSVHKHPKVFGMKKGARFCRSIRATSPRVHGRMPAPPPSSVGKQKKEYLSNGQVQLSLIRRMTAEGTRRYRLSNHPLATTPCQPWMES